MLSERDYMKRSPNCKQGRAGEWLAVVVVVPTVVVVLIVFAYLTSVH
jgi:hypothetical protein